MPSSASRGEWLLGALLAAGCGGEGAGAPQGVGVGARANSAETAAAVAGWRLPVAARYELACPGKPEGVAIGDVDGDGAAELVAATREPGALAVWASARAAPRVIAIGDWPLGPLLLEHDGRALVVVAPRASGELLVLDLAAPDPLASAARVSFGATPRAIACGDLDADGTAEIACTTRDGRLLLFAGRALSPAGECALADAQPTFVAVTAEGVLVGSQSSESVRAYVRDASGVLSARAEAIALGGIPRAHRRADFDGDGASEDLVAGGDGALWRIVDAFGAGRAERIAAQPGDVPIDVERVPSALGTTPRPGAESRLVVTLSFRDLSYVLWREGVAVHREYAGQDAWDAAAGDLDGDGAADLAFALRDASRVAVVLGRRGGGFAEAARVPVARGPHALAAADLDADGEPEILAVCALDDALCVLERPERSERDEHGERPERSEHDGRGWRRASTIPARPAADRVRAGDLDGDGRADVAFLVRGEGGSRLVVLWSESGRALDAWPRAELELGGGASDLLLADLDADGRVEAIAADPERGLVLLVSASGARELALAQSLAVASAPRALALVDAPTNGASEPQGGTPAAVHDARTIAVALGEPGPRTGLALLAITREGGAPSLAEAAFVPVEAGFPIDVAIVRSPAAPAQVALLSKARAGDGPGRVDLYVRAGATLEARGAPLVTGLRPYAIASGDLDGDGFDDLAVGAQNSHHVNVWTRAGGEPARLPDLGAGRGVLDVLCADLDGDGHPELVAANAFSHDVSVIGR